MLIELNSIILSDARWSSESLRWGAASSVKATIWAARRANKSTAHYAPLLLLMPTLSRVTSDEWVSGWKKEVDGSCHRRCHANWDMVAWHSAARRPFEAKWSGAMSLVFFSIKLPPSSGFLSHFISFHLIACNLCLRIRPSRVQVLAPTHSPVRPSAIKTTRTVRQ